MSDRYFTLYPDILETWAELTDEECGRLVRALAFYRRTGQPPAMTGHERLLFPVYKAQIDRDDKSYVSRCQTNAENGKKGGRPKTKKTESFFEKPNKSEKSQEKEKEKDIPLPTLPGEVSEFDRFWSEYPKKVGKIAAKKAFERARNRTTLESLLTAIRRQKCGSQWSRDNGQYIPNPATWLNQGRWEDEVPGMPECDRAPARRWHMETIDGEETVVYDD